MKASVLIFIHVACAFRTSEIENVIDTAIGLKTIANNGQLVPETEPMIIQPIPLHGVTASPKCWKSAIEIFRTKADSESLRDASALCASMPETYQKRLALEISKCHLNDLGKDLYRDESSRHYCSQDNIRAVDYDTMLPICLKQLTSGGETTYTIYITYVQNLCIRLTQEALLEYQQQNQLEISERYAELSMQSIRQLQAIREVADQHAAQVAELALIPAIIKDQLSKELANQMKQTIETTVEEELKTQLSIQLKEQVAVNIQKMLQTQSLEQEKLLSRIVDNIEQRDSSNKERFEDWTEYLVAMWQKQAHAMDQQQERFNDHRRQMETLSATVHSTTHEMLPLFGLQRLIQVAATGYTWITFLLFFVGTFNIVWLVTHLSRCYSVRPYMYGIVLSEAILEMTTTAALRYEVLSEVECIQYVTELRRWAIFLECLTFVSSVLTSCFIDRANHDNYVPRQYGPRNNTTVDTNKDINEYHETPFHQNYESSYDPKKHYLVPIDSLVKTNRRLSPKLSATPLHYLSEQQPEDYGLTSGNDVPEVRFVSVHRDPVQEHRWERAHRTLRSNLYREMQYSPAMHGNFAPTPEVVRIASPEEPYPSSTTDDASIDVFYDPMVVVDDFERHQNLPHSPQTILPVKKRMIDDNNDGDAGRKRQKNE